MNRWIASALAALLLCVAGASVQPAWADGKGATKALRQAGSGPPPPVAGPAAPQGVTGTVPLPSGGTVAVPAGYKLYGAPEAKAYLGRIGKTAAPGDVMGMIAPEKSKLTDKDFWGAVLTWSPIGYVAGSGADQFGQPTFLDSVKAGRGVAAPAPDSLPVPPAYDAKRAALTWAEQYKAVSPTDRNVRVEGRVLARDGFTGVTIHCRSADIDARKADLAKAIAAVAFPPGRAHADYRSGDLDSGFDVPGLITGSRPTKAVAEAASVDGPKPQAAAGDAAPSWFPWIGAALIGVPLLLWLIYGRKPPEPPEADTLILTPRPVTPPPEPPPTAASVEPSIEEVKPAEPPKPPPSGPDPNITPPSS